MIVDVLVELSRGHLRDFGRIEIKSKAKKIEKRVNGEWADLVRWQKKKDIDKSLDRVQTRGLAPE